MYRLFFLFAFILISLTGKSQEKPPAKKPNIILFIADDLGVEDTGPYGNKIIRTPHLDRLAKESLLFENAFAGSPTCGPSRSTILTGMMPFRHGAHGNHSAVDKAHRSLVHYLNPLGYKTAIAGKLHVGPESVFPFERIPNTNVPEPGFEKKPGLHYDLAMDPVDQWLAQQDDDPFMLVVADHSPHVVWPENASYDPSEVDIPEQHIDTRETRKSRARYYTDITKMDKNLGQLLQSLTKYNLEENTIVIFTSDQGPQWPFAKWSLYDYGIKVPLLIRWPGQISPGTSTAAMISQADLLPTFVEIAGGTAPTQVDGKSFLRVLKGEKAAHHERVFATHTGDGMMNRSPARMLRTDQYKFILNLAPEIPYTTHMDRANDHDGGREYWDSWRQQAFYDRHAASVLWRYHNHPQEELYDIKNDPHETKNLANDPKYAALLEGFRKELKAWRADQGDFETGPEALSDKRKNVPKSEGAPYVF